ncbi:MAG TPA: hypothetical protein VNP04_15920 [Alphaproteobacteria bacterium]|nr:hypothetical protein [Alphaproteobacteria bacterium]
MFYEPEDSLRDRLWVSWRDQYASDPVGYRLWNPSYTGGNDWNTHRLRFDGCDTERL